MKSKKEIKELIKELVFDRARGYERVKDRISLEEYGDIEIQIKTLEWVLK